MLTVKIDFQKSEGRGTLKGTCPNCKNNVYAPKWQVDDAFNCDWFCPHCKALLYITHRTSISVEARVPYMEELICNDSPTDVPNRGWINEGCKGKSKDEIMDSMGWSVRRDDE
jgi:phage FluMu protein Com